MRLLRNVPIKRKLMLITMATSCVALLLACIAFAGYEQVHARKFMVDDLWGKAGMIGYNSSAALSFNDPESAEQTLRSIGVDEHIVCAAVYDRDGKLFAAYVRDAGSFVPPPVQPEGQHFGDDHVELSRKLIVAGEPAGTVYIRSDLAELRERLWRFASIVVLVMVAASLVALLLSSVLLGVITQPISDLAGVVRRIAAQRDYSVRAAKQGDDELGHLIDGFNDMLREIQTRDHALESAREGLEQRVRERTGELQQEIAERKQAEVALRSSEERFSSAFEYASIGVALVAPDGKWLKVNRALCDLVGYSEAELLASSFQEITHPDDLDADLEYVRKVLAREIQSYQMEKRYFHKDGHTVWATLSVSLVRDARGQPLNFISQIQDITTRKRAEAELAQTHRQLLEASRLGGMAEIATNVLHNVGNVLNSVNVSASLVTESIKKSRAANLARVAALLREHQDDFADFVARDPKGRHLPAYLDQLSEHLLADQKAAVKELELLRGNIDHIKEIVAMQQNYAKVSGLREVVSIQDLVEDSLRMNAGALARHGVEVVRDFHDVPMLSIEKHKVLQILVNLVRNAKYACDDSGRADKRMTIRVAQAPDCVRVSVIDNGVGIPPENLTRIFNHGFTTRKLGHGFGLHSGALAAREMGGSLVAHSEGPGRGATFTLELPVQLPE